MVNVNGCTHLIGGSQNSKHFVWNDLNKSLNPVFDFANIKVPTPSITYWSRETTLSGIEFLRGSCLIHVASQNKLLLFGGDTFNGYYNLSYIYEYSLETKVWGKWNDTIQLTCVYAGAVLTDDERYVIIVGGNFSDKIYVLDIIEPSLKRSSIKCPKQGSHLINKMGNEFLINTFIKITSNHIEIPMDIIGLVGKYFGNEVLHWIQYNNGDTMKREHYVISFDDILASV